MITVLKQYQLEETSTNIFISNSGCLFMCLPIKNNAYSDASS